MVEWVEVTGGSVEVAVKAALQELGIEDEERADVKVLQSPHRGFLGIGRQDAIVRVKSRSGRSRQTSRRGPKNKPSSRQGRGSKQREAQAHEKTGRSSGNARKRDRSRRSDRRPDRSTGPAAARKARDGRAAGGKGGSVSGDRKQAEVSAEDQAAVVKEFLEGLLEEFGLEGEVDTRFEGRLLLADVSGEQTEALIGPKASVMHAVHELTKTVVQRRTARGSRIRLDIAEYSKRRHRALEIYAGQLAEQVLEEEGEIMLEPMNASDRKVVHQAVASIEGVRSYSEGEEPRRAVVISQA